MSLGPEWAASRVFPRSWGPVTVIRGQQTFAQTLAGRRQGDNAQSVLSPTAQVCTPLAHRCPGALHGDSLGRPSRTFGDNLALPISAEGRTTSCHYYQNRTRKCKHFF